MPNSSAVMRRHNLDIIYETEHLGSERQKQMPTPFPGMDPYLERREHWHAVHTRRLVASADALGPQV